MTTLCASNAASLAFSALAVRVRGSDVRLEAGNLPCIGVFDGVNRQDIGLIGRESREYRTLLLSAPGVDDFLPSAPALAPIPDVNFSCTHNMINKTHYSLPNSCSSDCIGLGFKYKFHMKLKDKIFNYCRGKYVHAQQFLRAAGSFCRAAGYLR